MAKAAKKKVAKGKAPQSKDGAAEALLAAAMTRYGQRLDAQEVKTLRATARQLANAAATLKAFELANGEEPVNGFAVIDEEQ